MISDNVDVVSIGNAIVDIVNPIDFSFLKKNKLVPGSMNLLDDNKSKKLLSQINPNKEIISGGSAANTAVGISSFGGKAAFIGKVKDDQYGNFFKKDLDYMNVSFDTEFTKDGPPTATSIISVTPDRERTMCTYLGACLVLDINEINEKIIAKSKILLLKGLFMGSLPKAKRSFLLKGF
jgi:Sugar kinases, ribokinase family